MIELNNAKREQGKRKRERATQKRKERLRRKYQKIYDCVKKKIIRAFNHGDRSVHIAEILVATSDYYYTIKNEEFVEWLKSLQIFDAYTTKAINKNEFAYRDMPLVFADESEN